MNTASTPLSSPALSDCSVKDNQTSSPVTSKVVANPTPVTDSSSTVLHSGYSISSAWLSPPSSISTKPTASPATTLTGRQFKPSIPSSLSLPKQQPPKGFHIYSHLIPEKPIDFRLCFISRLPKEILVHILSNLDADEMKIATGVCRQWKSVVSDDLCWKAAFGNYFGGFPQRRLAVDSWRSEYLKRLALGREWHRSRQGIQSEPRIGRIDQMHVDHSEGRAYLGSLDRGMISIYNLFTGKVEKSSIFCSPDNLQISIGCMKIDKARIAIGYLDGSVGIITNFKGKGLPTRQKFAAKHMDAVTCLNWLPHITDILVSGSADGMVRLWYTPTETCLKQFQADGSGISHLYINDRNYIIAGTEAGQCVAWNIDVMLFSHCNRPKKLRPIESDVPKDSGVAVTASRIIKCGDQPIKFIEYNTISQSIAVVLNSPHANAANSNLPFEETLADQLTETNNACISIWHIPSGKQCVIFKSITLFTEITSLAWDATCADESSSSYSLLVAGDRHGSLHIWKVPSLQTFADHLVTIMTWESLVSLHNNPVCKLSIDGHKIVSGSSDGKVKVLDAMSGKLITGLALKIGRQSWEEWNGIANRDAMCNIWTNEYSLLVSFHETVKFWSFETMSKPRALPGRKSKNKINRRTSDAIFGRNDRGIYTQTDHVDMQNDIHEIRQEIEAERMEHAILMQQREAINGINHIQSGMTDDELLSYALMISAEQLQADQARRAECQTLLPQPTHSARSADSATSSCHSSTLSNVQRFTGSKECDDWDDDDHTIDAEAAEYLSPQTTGSRPNTMILNLDELDLNLPGNHRIVLSSGASRTSQNKLEDNDWSSASMLARRSPRIAPYSPSLHPQYRGRHHQSTGNVVVIPQRTLMDEEEELVYVLEMSRVEAEEAGYFNSE
ncbi:hypothetical protein BDEG_21054 [Batrachochytrium dendrobatidis JEL423]|uniref:F-box domain-containing protein n=2 Tax=Batrachochytrium dendrobatidis (strain JEL423) TaxID=403673 RepID=A0A177WA61_BATDL|nr:hypothetical protein BDEG_21054 [Batrachochytrium dendrobatidis JEL423]